MTNKNRPNHVGVIAAVTLITLVSVGRIVDSLCIRLVTVRLLDRTKLSLRNNEKLKNDIGVLRNLVAGNWKRQYRR